MTVGAGERLHVVVLDMAGTTIDERGSVRVAVEAAVKQTAMVICWRTSTPCSIEIEGARRPRCSKHCSQIPTVGSRLGANMCAEQP
jgi:uncharacterized protein YabE (DUF348 family)